MVPVDTLTRAFTETYGEGNAPEVYFAPGRVNLIGEHIDYSGGRVLPAAISLGISAAVRYRPDGKLRFRSREEGGEAAFDLSGARLPAEGWGKFPRGVAAALLESGIEPPGCDVLFASDLPEGSGLSSSAALEVLTAYLLVYPARGESLDRVRLAQFCKRVENDFIGVQCGIMDQFAVAMGKCGHAILLDTAALEYEYVPAATGEWELVVMNTNKKRVLSDSKYNERRSECESAFTHLNRLRPSGEPLRSLVEAGAAEVDALEDRTLRKRARHAVTENRRVVASVGLLKGGDVAGFGKLLVESHRSLRDDYEVTGEHLDALVESALHSEGCIGARMTGAGFGGCAVALVARSAAGAFDEAAGKAYEARTGLRADFYRCGIVDGVGKIR